MTNYNTTEHKNRLFWERLASCGTKLNADKNTYLHNLDDSDSEAAYLLNDGICALTSINKRGEETIYLYFRAKRLIGFNPLLAGRKLTRETGVDFPIVTKTACTFSRIPGDTLHELIASDSDFNRFLLHTLADNYQEVLIHFHRMQEESAVARLCRLLVDISVEKNGKKTVPRFFTYGELAKYLGTHPVTVSRIMAKLKQCGCIAKSAMGITLEREDLLAELIAETRSLAY